MLIFKKEKTVRKLALEHAATVARCLQATRDTLQDYLAGPGPDFSEHVRRVGKLESRADALKREACEVLQAGAFLPTIRSDVYRLIEAVDHVAGEGEDIARFLADQSPMIPQEYHEEFRAILALNLECYDELLKALSCYYKPQGAIEDLDTHAARVGKLESEIDRRQVALTQWIFSSRLPLSSRIHITQLLTALCEISNSAEHVADELKFAALKSVV